jgi:sugar/nucleoside kinase (ribokinase family)
VHLDIHALILGDLSQASHERSFGSGRQPRPVRDWQRWLRLADSVQLNELELRWLAAPAITTEGQLVEWVTRDTPHSRLRTLIVTKAANGATVYDLARGTSQHVDAPVVNPTEPTGSGDVFGSVFCYSLLSGESPVQATRRAVEWASWNTTLHGIESLLTAPLPEWIEAV